MNGYKKYVVPGSIGLIVRYPRDKIILSEKGGWVPWTGPEGRYWRRRLKCGDVKLASPPVPAEKIEVKKKKGK